MISGLSSVSMTNTAKKGILLKAFGFVGLFLVAGALLSSCKNKPEDIDDIVSKYHVDQDRAEDVTIIYSEEGITKVRLYAKEFIKNETAKPPYTEMKEGLKVEFFDDSLHVISTLTARYGRYYEEAGNVIIRDSVVVVNAKGEQLHTEELIWNQAIRKIFTEKFVRINTPTQIMYGEGLEANEDFSWYRIKKPTGIVQVNKDQVSED